MAAKRKHTPDEEAAIVARYIECANASQVAREFNTPQRTVSDIISRHKAANFRRLHEQATSRAIREARKSLSKKTKLLEAYLASKTGADGIPDLDPKDLAALVQTNSSILQRLLDAEQRIDAVKLGRLTRELRRKEIELAKLRIAAGGVEQHEHTVSTVDARTALASMLARKPPTPHRE